MIGFYTKFTTSAEDRAKLVAVFSQASSIMGEIAGCKLYDVTLNTADPAVTAVIEVWTDEIAHDASLQSEAAKTLIAQAMPLMAALPKQIKLGPVVTSWLD